MTDWQMRRIESPTENPCCALVLEANGYVVYISYCPESRTWYADMRKNGRVITASKFKTLPTAMAVMSEGLDILR